MIILMCTGNNFRCKRRGRNLGVVLNKLFNIFIHSLFTPAKRILVNAKTRLSNTISIKNNPVIFLRIEPAGAQHLAFVAFCFHADALPLNRKIIFTAKQCCACIVIFQYPDLPVMLNIHDCERRITYFPVGANR